MAPRTKRSSKRIASTDKIEDVDPDNVYCLRVLTDRVKVPASRLNIRMHAYITDILRSKYQNICSRFGYVREGAIELVHVSDPEVQTAHLNGDCVCRVAFRVWVCNPCAGTCMRGVVMRANKFGVMVAAGPVQCVLAKAPVSDSLKSSDLDSLAIGDTTVFRVAGVRFDVMDAFISTVGTLATEADLNADIDRLRAAAHNPDGVLHITSRIDDEPEDGDDVDDASVTEVDDADGDQDADVEADGEPEDTNKDDDGDTDEEVDDDPVMDADDDIDDGFSSGADDDDANGAYSD